MGFLHSFSTKCMCKPARGLVAWPSHSQFPVALHSDPSTGRRVYFWGSFPVPSRRDPQCRIRHDTNGPTAAAPNAGRDDRKKQRPFRQALQSFTKRSRVMPQQCHRLIECLRYGWLPRGAQFTDSLNGYRNNQGLL